jgi:hypothetical protein
LAGATVWDACGVIPDTHERRLIEAAFGQPLMQQTEDALAWRRHRLRSEIRESRHLIDKPI